jgi:hypothetical protein
MSLNFFLNIATIYLSAHYMPPPSHTDPSRTEVTFLTSVLVQVRQLEDDGSAWEGAAPLQWQKVEG